jgi:hypothetical protein
MSDAEMRRRQKLQGKIGRTTSTLGLSGVALTGAAIATKKKPGALKAVTKVPGLSRVSHGGLKNAAFHTSIAAGGIGGVGGFNQAAIYSAESRKRKAATVVKKEFGMEMGYYGEEGRPLTHQQIEAEIEKAWTPSASNFDSERSRHRRTGAYQAGAMAAAGAGGAYAARHGVKAVQQGKKIQSIPDSAQIKTVEETVRPKAGKEFTRNVKRAGKTFRALDADVVGRTLKHGGKAGLGLAAVGGAAATHSAINRKKSGSWQSYAKRDATSAFGVDHSDNPNGQHRETEN